MFLQSGLVAVTICAWISNHMPSEVWDEITYPLPNFNGCTFGVWEWISYFIPYFIMDVPYKYENAYTQCVASFSMEIVSKKHSSYSISFFISVVVSTDFFDRYSEFGAEMYRSVHSEWCSWSHSATMHNCKVCYWIISKWIMAWCVVADHWAPNSMEIMMTASNGNILFRCRSKQNIKAPRQWPLWEEFTEDRWIPRTNGQ